MKQGIHPLILFRILHQMAIYTALGAKVESKPKKTRQGNSKHTKYSATARNSARKPYRGQGK